MISVFIIGDTINIERYKGKFQLECITHSVTDVYGTKEYGGLSTMRFSAEFTAELPEEIIQELEHITRIRRDRKTIRGVGHLSLWHPISEIREDCFHPNYDAPIVGYRYHFWFNYNAQEK